jgi:hypothetical protein
MKTFRTAIVSTLAIASLALAGLATATLAARQAATKSSAQEALDKLKTLEGDWIDVDGAFGTNGAVAITYRLTSGGHTVVETFVPKTPDEMVTVYHLDGDSLVLTHYCSGGTQPRMRSAGLKGNALTFDFDGGTNIDPAKTSHMHSAKIEFVSNDEIRGRWTSWSNGKPDEQHTASFRAIRKK